MSDGVECTENNVEYDDSVIHDVEQTLRSFLTSQHETLVLASSAEKRQAVSSFRQARSQDGNPFFFYF